MHIIYSWLMWKLPIFVFLFQMVSDQKDAKLRFIPWIVVFVFCLLADILLIVFAINTSAIISYSDWMSFTGFFLFSLIVVSIGNKDSPKSPLLTTVFMFLFIALMYSCYTILFPGLYNVYVQNVAEVAPYLQIYLFPLFDLILYSILLVGNARIDPKAR